MNIVIVGAGHIGTTLACYIKHAAPEHKVSLYVRDPARLQNPIKCNDLEQQTSWYAQIDRISKDPAELFPDAELIYVAQPHFLIEGVFAAISPYVAKGAYICVLPGCGGCEFMFRKFFGEEVTLLGFQRVPFTAKLVEYGKETNLKSWKPFSVIGTIKGGDLEEGCRRIEACALKTRKAANYLAVTLAPSNPVLHTARTHQLFGSFPPEHRYPEKCKFYVGWTDETSRTMLAVDAELHALLDAIPEIDSSAIRPLTEHYESPTVEAMTRKINSIATFQTVFAPMIPAEDGEGFVADRKSRMFVEDFPWGLAIIRGFCEIIGTPAPTMDELLSWYADYMGLEWYVDGKFCGKDLDKTGIPQNYGITTREQLLSYYI